MFLSSFFMNLIDLTEKWMCKLCVFLHVLFFARTKKVRYNKKTAYNAQFHFKAEYVKRI